MRANRTSWAGTSLEYYNPTAKFPHGICQNGILLNTYWDIGGMFTLIILTEPERFWKNG